MPAAVEFADRSAMLYIIALTCCPLDLLFIDLCFLQDWHHCTFTDCAVKDSNAVKYCSALFPF
jgi:hypothetical protein